MAPKKKRPPSPSESSDEARSDTSYTGSGIGSSSEESSDAPPPKAKAKAKVKALREAQAKVKQRMQEALQKQMNSAATKVQAVWRGKQDRTAVVGLKRKREIEEAKRVEDAFKRKLKIAEDKEKAQKKKENERRRKDEEKAATLLQKTWRGKMARMELNSLKTKKQKEEDGKRRMKNAEEKRRRRLIEERKRKEREEKAALVIQKWWRGHQARLEFQEKIKWNIKQRQMKKDKWAREYERKNIEQKLQHVQAKRTVVGKYSRAGPVITGNESFAREPRKVTGNGLLTNEQWTDRQTSLAELDRKLKELEDRRMGSRARHIAQSEAARWEQGPGMQRFHGWSRETRGFPGMGITRNRDQLDSMLGPNNVTNLEIRQRPMAGMEAFARGGQSPTVADIYQGRESPRREYGWRYPTSFQPPAREWGGVATRFSRTPPPDFGRSRDYGWPGASDLQRGDNYSPRLEGGSAFDYFSGGGREYGGGTTVYGGGGGGGAGGGYGGGGSHTAQPSGAGHWNRNDSPNFGASVERDQTSIFAAARSPAAGPSFGSTRDAGALGHSRSTPGLDALGTGVRGALPSSPKKTLNAGTGAGAGGLDIGQRPWDNWQPPSGSSARSNARAALKQAVADLEKSVASRP